ncbi:GH39 family glycosyl hydrolase [Eisenbergiella sp.]
MNFFISKEVKTYPHKKHWQFCVGSGHAALALRTDYTRQLKFIHDELGIQYVRFHGIFADDMNTMHDMSVQFDLPGAQEFTEQSFHTCGIAYDNVLETGMKPFVELSFMPKKLAARDSRSMFYYKPNIAPPADYGKWADYIKAFIRFLEHRYGAEEVRTWFFEVWNEPDLRVAFFDGTKEEYFRLYETTVRAIKEVDDKLRVGGPATSGSKWIHSFVEFCEKNLVPVDFISTHQYAGDPLGGVDASDDMDEEEGQQDASPEAMQAYMGQIAKMLSKIEDKTFLGGLRTIMPDKSETEDIPNDHFMKNAAIVRSQSKGLPVYYTEWNENAIFGAYTNDTRKVAAYDVKTALDVAKDVDGSSIWCFSDIFEELHPFPQEFHGGFGILTLDGIPKPIFYGMKMLAEAGDERMELGEEATKGEIGIAGFVREEEKQLLLFRQKMKNENLPKEKAYIQIETEKTPGKVIVSRIDEEHCNPLKIWEEMGCPLDMNKAEIAELTQKSTMKEEVWEYEYRDGIVEVSVELGVNDIYFIRVL